MLESRLSQPVPEIEIFPDGLDRSRELSTEAFEIMGQWLDPTTKDIKTWVRFYCVDSEGNQVGREAFSRFFDPMDSLLFTCFRQLRSTLAIQPHQRQEDLTPEEQELVAEILRARTAPKAAPSLLQRVRAYLVMIRRKAGGLDRRAISPVEKLFLRGAQ